MMRTLVLRLIADYMRLPADNVAAYEVWARRVREAFPYGKSMLTCKLGELIGERLGYEDAMERGESA